MAFSTTSVVTSEEPGTPVPAASVDAKTMRASSATSRLAVDL